MEKSYYRIMLGTKSIYANGALSDGWVGVGFLQELDLTNKFPENMREFNREYVPIYLETYPGKSKIAAGLACGVLHKFGKGLEIGDIILTPDSEGLIHFGEISGDYFYDPTSPLTHKRPVTWYDLKVPRAELSIPLLKSLGFRSTISNLTPHADEIEKFLQAG